MKQKKAQEKLQQELAALKISDAKLRSLFHALDDVILEFDYAGNYISIAPTSPNLLILPSEKLLGTNLAETFSAEETKLFLDNIQTAIDTDSKQHFEYSLTLEGQKHFFRATVSPLPHRKALYVARDITFEKAAANDLQTSHKILNTILNNIPNGFILIDEDYIIRQVNRRTCEITGYSQEELIGKLCDLICPKGSGSHACPILAEGKNEFWGMETTIKCKDGQLTPILKNAQTAILDGKQYLIESFQDITERKKYEKSIRESKERFELLSNTSFEGIITHNNGKINYANESFQRMTGFSLDEMKSSNLFSQIPLQADRTKVIKNSQIAWAKPYQIKVKRKDGSSFLAEIEGKDIFFQGSKLRLAAIRDITEREATKKQLEQNNKRYQYLYNTTPVSIWEEDFSEIYKFIEAKKAAGISDFEEYFSQHPEDVTKCSMLAKVLDCNQTTLDMFEAKSKNDFFQNLNNVFTEDSFGTFKDQLVLIANNISSYEGICKNQTLAGKTLTVSVRWNVVPAYKQNYQRVLVSITDITEKSRAEKVQQAVYQISNAFTNSNNLHDLAQEIQDILGNIIDTTNFYIALYDKQTDSFNMVYCADVYDNITIFPAGKTLTGYLIRQQGSLIVDSDEQIRLQESGLIDDIGQTSAVWMGVPLRKEQDIIGAIVVQSYQSKNAYSKDDREILEFIAEQISTLLIKKKAQEELSMVQNRLELATSMLRHDIANDLGVISSALKLYKRAEKKELLLEMEKRIMKSLKLIQQHREQEHFIETHQNLQPFDLRKILSQLTSHYSEVDFEIIGEGKVYADQAIFSVFDNLISNAIKHGKASKIFIKIQNKNGNCEIIFQDNGQGIDQQYQQKIFEKGKSFGKTGNTGLGLHIVKQCLEQYGGRVFLADSDTSGACFFIKLPKVLID